MLEHARLRIPFGLSTGSRRHYLGNKLPSLEMKKDDASATVGIFLLSKMPAKIGITRVGETWPWFSMIHAMIKVSSSYFPCSFKYFNFQSNFSQLVDARDSTIPDSTTWIDVRTLFITRFSDGSNKLSRRMEVEHSIQADGEHAPCLHDHVTGHVVW